MTFWTLWLWGVVQVSYLSVSPNKSLYAKGFSPLLIFFQCCSQLCTTFLLFHLSNTFTVPTPNYLFPSSPASNQSSLLMILGMPGPHGHFIPRFILHWSALNSWSGNASAIAAIIYLHGTTVGMWYRCWWNSALGGARCNSHFSVDNIGLVLCFWVVVCGFFCCCCLLFCCFVLFFFFFKEVLGCQMQAVWPTLKSSLLVHVSETGLSLPFL